jgi:hypothetical protein
MRKIVFLVILISGMTVMLSGCSNQTASDNQKASNGMTSVADSSEASPEKTPSESSLKSTIESPAVSPDAASKEEGGSQPLSDAADGAPDEQNQSNGLFLEFEGAHGIVFDDSGNMFIGKKTQEIYRVTPDAQASLFMSVDSLADKTDKTKIWNMSMGPGGYVYAAAGDRILRINSEGAVETFLTDDFTGEWGACDLAFDSEENLYVVHDRMVEKYCIVPGAEPVKTTLLDGRNDFPLLRAAVGICFGKDFKDLYVSDVFGNKVVKCTFNEDGTIGEMIEYTSFRSAEYMEADHDGNIYVSLPAENSIARIAPSGEESPVATGNLLREPTTLAFGKGRFEAGSLYITVKNGVYRIPVEN